MATLALIHSAAEYCAPVSSRSVHTRLIDKPINDALRLVTGCLRPTPTDNLFVLSGVTPTELRRKRATLSLLVVPRSLVIYSMIGSRPTLMEGIDSGSQDIPLCPLLYNCSEMQAVWAPMQLDRCTTGGALSGGKSLLVCIHYLMMWTSFHLEWGFPHPPGSGWTVSGLE